MEFPKAAMAACQAETVGRASPRHLYCTCTASQEQQSKLAQD